MLRVWFLSGLRFVLGAMSALAVVACAAPPTPTPPPPTPLPVASVLLKGEGATFPAPIYNEWAELYPSVDPSVRIEYRVTGSGAGKKAAVENTVDFAGSDSLLTTKEYERGQDLQMYPMLAGAVVIIYNIENISGVPTLILDRETLVGIYDGTISHWNDSRLLALNPERATQLPAQPITVVHRADGSGTTEIFTKGLAAFSAQWKTQVGSGTSVDWPTDKLGRGVGRDYNSGVAAMVGSTPNSIGYVELAYAVTNNLLYARLKNRAGNIVTAGSENVQAAMADFAGTFSDRLTTDIVDGSGQNSWPLAGYTYLILHTQRMTDCVKARKLVEYIRWSLTDDFAQQRATALGYSPLPNDVRQLVLTRLARVMCQNQPLLSP